MGLLKLYDYYNTELADKRTNDWPLITSPVPITLISCVYLYFILQCGPKYMKDRKPYSFYIFIRFYNVFQIIANALIVYHMLDAGWYQDYFIYCGNADYSLNPKAYKLAEVAWYAFCLKLIDYTETCLFVLRKKDKQVSFLHLYHHVSTLVIVWFITKYFAHGMSMTCLLVNCSVHVIMYTYYLLASFGPKIQQLLQPLKPMITIVQIVQFWILIIYYLRLIPNCHGTAVIGSVIAADTFINFILFYDFYKKSYTSKKIKKS